MTGPNFCAKSVQTKGKTVDLRSSHINKIVKLYIQILLKFIIKILFIFISPLLWIRVFDFVCVYVCERIDLITRNNQACVVSNVMTMH